MKKLIGVLLILIAFLVWSCASPVKNAQAVRVGTGSGLPLGSGMSVYIASSDGNGVASYLNGGTSWTFYDWDSLFTYPYPAVNDVFVDSSGRIYAATDSGLLYYDGTTWMTVNNSARTNSVTVYGGVVYASTDSGLKTSSIPLVGSSSWASPTITDSANDGIVISFFVATGPTYFAATPSGLVKSSDATSWSLVTGGYPKVGFMNAVASNGTTIFAGTPLGISLSTNSGASWTNYAASAGVGGGVHGITIGSGGELYLGCDNGVSVGSTSSTSWVLKKSGIYSKVNNVGIGTPTSTLYAATDKGLALSTDTGSTWDTLFYGLKVSKVFVTVP